MLATLAAFDLVAGVGNRATDVSAYTNAGLAPERILVKLPEFESELAADLDDNKAVGFELYSALDMPALVSASTDPAGR
jgi:hypothetical protein